MTLRIGTRGSALALAQARLAAAALGRETEIIVVKTRGDRDRAAIDKSKWVAELESALEADEIDVAVHSAKDVPTDLAAGTVLAGVLPREDASDVLIRGTPATGPAGELPLAADVVPMGAGTPHSAAPPLGLDGLPQGARVGTAALRRAAQLRARRPDLDIVEIRGNVDTRLAKLAGGEVDAVVLAAAGLLRLGRPEAIATLDTVPAAGQGCVVLQTRAPDAAGMPRDAAAWAALSAERACVAALGADCHSAVGAHATLADDGATLVLRAWAGLVDGSEWITDERTGTEPGVLGGEVAQRMLAAGAAALIAGAGG